MREKMKAIALRWMAELWQQGNAEVLSELHAPEFADRSPGKRKGDNAGFAAGVRDLYKAFPDFYAAAEDVLIDESHSQVVVRWAGTGTHLGKYLGLEPTGKRITFRGIEILTITEGKVSERWGEWDGMDLLQQLGLWKG